MALNKRKSPELEALLEQRAEMERQIKEAQQEQQAEENAAKKAAERNPTAYGLIVHGLYERLGVEAEHPSIRRSRNGGETEIATDTDESLRTERLMDVLGKLIDAADDELLEELKVEDDLGRDARRDEREEARRKREAKAADADAAADDDAEDDQDVDEENSAAYAQFA